MAGQTGKVRRRMTDQEREQIEKQGRSEAAAGRALREGMFDRRAARAVGRLFRGRQKPKPIDMRFTTTQPTVKGLEKDWDRLPATPNPRVSLRRKRLREDMADRRAARAVGRLFRRRMTDQERD
jgi:hypothetical protein